MKQKLRALKKDDIDKLASHGIRYPWSAWDLLMLVGLIGDAEVYLDHTLACTYYMNPALPCDCGLVELRDRLALLRG